MRLPILLSFLFCRFGSCNGSIFSKKPRNPTLTTATTTTTTTTTLPNDSSPSDLTAEILNRFRQELTRVPVVSRRSSILNSTIDIRVKWQDEKNMVTYCEVPFVPILPSTFQGYFHRVAEEMPQADVMVQSIVELETDPASHRQALKGILHAPFPCSNRLLVLWKYVFQPAPNEHLLVLTDRDNQLLKKKYQTPKEKKTLVEAKALIAYWVRPVQDDNQQIVGSQLQYLFHGDIGGKIPKWIKSTVGPRGAYDTVHGLLKHLHKKEQ